jgi:hypothetical protein
MLVSRRRCPARCTLLRIPNNPSSSGRGGDTDEPDPIPGLSPDLVGVRSFHNATTFLTDARGERGDVCGRRSPAGGVADV